MIRALVAGLVIVLLTGAADAAPRCISRSEARALWPRTHLYWTVVDKRRCWSNRRGRYYDMAPASPLVVKPLLYVSPELVPQRVEVPRELPNLLEGWDWLEPAQSAIRNETVFSSFEADPPDVWPALRQEPNIFQMIFFVAGVVSALFFLWSAVFQFAVNGRSNEIRAFLFRF